jgi:hypothetical protein
VSAGLIEPEDDDEILDADPDALRFNAVMTGDVFVDVAAAGCSAPVAVMVAGHPCTIRGRDGALQPRIACVRVVAFQSVPYRRWPTGFFNHFPLPAIAGVDTQAADLQEWLTVEDSELHRERRRLTLTEWGVIVMQQRLIHSLTRFVAPTSALEEAARPVLREAELERDWVEGLHGTAALEQRIADFSAFMGDADRRARLRDRAKEAQYAERSPERLRLVRQRQAKTPLRNRRAPVRERLRPGDGAPPAPEASAATFVPQQSG